MAICKLAGCQSYGALCMSRAHCRRGLHSACAAALLGVQWSSAGTRCQCTLHNIGMAHVMPLASPTQESSMEWVAEDFKVNEVNFSSAAMHLQTTALRQALNVYSVTYMPELHGHVPVMR